ncbi:MAG: serine protease [Gemmatimonadaceae bacterium]|nr:serine protease [Gemmatimonadaceae bacterium]
MRRARPCPPGLVLPLAALLALLPASPRAAAAQDEPREATSTVFARYSERILKVQVIETSSDAKGTIGTGFLVSADGLMMTNYHVISDRVQEPAKHRVEVVEADGRARPVEVLAVDVVHDLAVLRIGRPATSWFTLAPVPVRQGDRLYSLGHPNDLGLSIVEGTYNGNLKHTLYPKIHFTGSINPGMSGGPTITGDGRVVGVNVSTMGEQRSFLVPETQATALLARVQAAGFRPAADLTVEIAQQLTAYQEAYLGTLLEGAPRLAEVGPFRVLTEPAPVFRCWGGSERSDEAEAEPTYTEIWHRCGTDDEVFIADDQSSGTIEIVHRVLTTQKLNAAQFGALYSQRFRFAGFVDGSEKHVTEWRCAVRNVRAPHTPVRAVLCLRALKRMPGLYDAQFHVALLGRRNAGLISTLTLTGASWANIDRLADRYLEGLAWR